MAIYLDAQVAKKNICYLLKYYTNICLSVECLYWAEQGRPICVPWNVGLPHSQSQQVQFSQHAFRIC